MEKQEHRKLSPWGLGGLTSPGCLPQALVYTGERWLRLHLNCCYWGRASFGGQPGLPSLPVGAGCTLLLFAKALLTDARRGALFGVG